MSQKIQSKVINYIEQAGQYKDKRQQFKALNKQYRELVNAHKPTDVSTVTTKVAKDVNGNEVTISKEKREKVFATPEMKQMYDDLKVRRKQILRFSKYATLYVNMFCDKLIQDFINACEPTQSKKTNERTYGWKQFNRAAFAKTFSHSLASSSKYYNDFVEVKALILKFQDQKEIDRLNSKPRLNKTDVRTVLQDLSVYKQIKSEEEKAGAEETAKQIDGEFGVEWGKCLGGIHSVLAHLQTDDAQSKLMFNSVKNATRVFQDSRSAPGSEQKVKISNGFKCLVSKVVLEFLNMLTYKIEVFLSESNSNQIKLADIRKIIRMTASLDSVEDLKAQFDAFDSSVQTKIREIEDARRTGRAKSQPAPTTTTV